MTTRTRQGTSVEDVETITSGEQGSETGRILDAAGNFTDEYNDTDDPDVDGAAAGTFIKTNLGRVDECTVDIEVDGAAGNAPFTVVETARPATQVDFESAEDFTDGTIFIRLFDPGTEADAPTELADDTDISGYSFTYYAQKQ
jgi:hypothetical protein